MNKSLRTSGRASADVRKAVDQKSRVRTGYSRLRVVGSGDAIHRPEAMPRPGRFRAVELGVVPASLSPAVRHDYKEAHKDR